ncbi:MAG TPA: ABC transporter substrate-binding protein [bacterium]
MKLRTSLLAVWGVATLALCLALPSTGQAQQPKHGGKLVFTIPASDMPSMDGHQETTFAVVHAVAPQYSLLIRIDPTDPKAKKYVGDVAQSWTVSADKKTYTFKLHNNVLFSDGSKLTSKDVVASFNHMINPPDWVISPR